MRLAILLPLGAVMVALPAAVAVAGVVAPAAVAPAKSAGPIIRAAFGDGPPTGAHHGRKHHGPETPKDTGPSQIDMHGATREGADQAYRKKYGF